MVTLESAVAAVVDPELQVVTIEDLGILRGVRVDADGSARVTITPTYSGCPAMDVIRADIRKAAASNGYERVEIVTELAPPWTTDWITPAGKAKLAAAGIAPPGSGPVPVPLGTRVACPRCGSTDTERLSAFGTTACLALWRCRACAEPFDHVKPF